MWLLLLVYYTTKCGVMSVATGWRALAARSAEPEQLQQLEQLKVRAAQPDWGHRVGFQEKNVW